MCEFLASFEEHGIRPSDWIGAMDRNIVVRRPVHSAKATNETASNLCPRSHMATATTRLLTTTLKQQDERISFTHDGHLDSV